MSDYIVTDSSGSHVMPGGASPDVFNTDAAAKAYALQLANTNCADFKVYSITLVGTYDFPSNTATWVAA